MSLQKKQARFTWMVSLLIQYAYMKGYELTFADAYATSGHIPHSKHYSRLAVDLNLFKNGKYLTETKDHEQLGIFWENIGGRWGGRWMGVQDGNHYEL